MIDSVIILYYNLGKLFHKIVTLIYSIPMKWCEVRPHNIIYYCTSIYVFIIYVLLFYYTKLQPSSSLKLYIVSVRDK